MLSGRASAKTVAYRIHIKNDQEFISFVSVSATLTPLFSPTVTRLAHVHILLWIGDPTLRFAHSPKMPDKSLTVVTYAASASLAAIALVYFFNPNYMIDGEPSSASASTRKKGVVGLFNPANDCFINSVLQSLAGIGDVRLYLIRELHRRKLDGPEVYSSLPDRGPDDKPIDLHETLSLQSGEVTKGLKEMIDRLNERPIQKKTISAASFVAVLEHAFNTRISKSQQDAQELLQIVAERLSEEYHAGRAARKRAGLVREVEIGGPEISITRTGESDLEELNELRGRSSVSNIDDAAFSQEESGFPLEGQTQSQIECQHCHFIPKANPTSFVMLTLNVPQTSATNLNECYDAHFKEEYIDDYKCDKCRLEHAIGVFSKDLARASSPEQQAVLQAKIDKLQRAMAEDPEKPPEGVDLPDKRLAPKRKIARHVKITTFPRVLVIHLSRSIYDPRYYSMKNAAKVSFPETFPLGGLINRRNYKLLGMVSHKGSHNSGHYESFRRQHIYAPTSNPHPHPQSGPYSASPSANPTPAASTIPSPQISPTKTMGPQGSPISSITPTSLGSPIPSIISPTASLSSVAHSNYSTRPSSGTNPDHLNGRKQSTQSSSPSYLGDSLDRGPQTRTSLDQASTRSQGSVIKDSLKKSGSLLRSRSRSKKPNDRWWRISDDKVKECKTSDVLGMQREVYMLFYEMEKG